MGKVFLTGVTGFTGCHVAKRLADKGYKLRVLVRQNHDIDKWKQKGYEVVTGDLADESWVDEALKDVDAVVHIAAIYRQAGVVDSRYWDVNYQGTKNLALGCLRHNIKRFVHCSTIGVLGHISNPPADETTPYNPGDIYQLTKCEAEKLVLNLHKEKGLPVVVIRPAAIYGPGDRRLLKLFRWAARRRFIMLGDGNTLYHMVYIHDLALGFQLALEKDGIDGEAYIIAGNEIISLNKLMEMIASELKVPRPKLHFPYAPVYALAWLVEKICIPLRIEPPIYRRRIDFFVKDRAFRIDKARILLGYQPHVSLAEGIHCTAQWYKEQGWL
jgi:nucleoside-diphosphate-sugar epimerase